MSDAKTGTKPDGDSATARTDRLLALEHRLRRRGESLDNFQLITRTFVSLNLTDRVAICDTVNSMVSTFLDTRHSLTLIDDGAAERLVVAGAQGVPDSAALTGPEAGALWRWLMDLRIARRVSGAEARERFPELPTFLAEGFVCVSLDIQDRPVGLMVFAGRSSGAAFADEDLEFLAAVAGLAAMALANADAHAAQQALIADVERKAGEAERAAAEKERALAELDQKLDIIKRQQFAIQELSTPILQLWEDVLALPVIGVVDSRRSVDIMERLLTEVTERQARFVILDITGVDVVDTRTADHFIKVIKAAELLGTTCIVTGIRPAVAQTLVQIGVDLSQVITLRNLQDGLRECLRRMSVQRDAGLQRTS